MFDTSQVTDMSSVFYGATSFNGNISNWSKFIYSLHCLRAGISLH